MPQHFTQRSLSSRVLAFQETTQWDVSTARISKCAKRTHGARVASSSDCFYRLLLQIHANIASLQWSRLIAKHAVFFRSTVKDLSICRLATMKSNAEATKCFFPETWRLTVLEGSPTELLQICSIQSEFAAKVACIVRNIGYSCLSGTYIYVSRAINTKAVHLRTSEQARMLIEKVSITSFCHLR